MPSIKDPEVKILATFSLTLQSDYPNEGENAWQESPFNWIRSRRSSRQRGAIGEKLVSSYLALKGFDVTRSRDSGADRIVGGKRAEIKTSTLWEGGFYKFQQLRNQNYDFALCLGISPFDAHCWVLPKDVVLDSWANRAAGMTSQHGGRSGTDTAWLSVHPDDVPQWLNEWGGGLSDAVELISEITDQKPLV